MYIYERKQWPAFSWDEASIGPILAQTRYLQGRLLGRVRALGFSLQEEAALFTLTQDVIKTSEIEGEQLSNQSVRSSVAQKLGINIGSILPIDRNVEGIVEVMIDATRNYAAPLTDTRLFSWHNALFAAENNLSATFKVGQWRTQQSGPMRVISGAYGREKIHFEAPDSHSLKKEMKQFIHWFNKTLTQDPVIKSALAHFWFVTIHPFSDGNGRIARAIADMTLALSENSPQRFYSMSAQIQTERTQYYAILESCQKESLNITDWLEWFLHCLQRAIINAEDNLKIILLKADFWQEHATQIFNHRQQLIINLLLDNNFIGQLTSSKWAKITKCSQDTALRDISDLIKKNVLLKDLSNGRSTCYRLK
jgi:Fic family protein